MEKRKELIRYDEFPISDELECVRTDDRYFHFNLPVNRVVSSSQRSDRSERWGREGGGEISLLSVNYCSTGTANAVIYPSHHLTRRK